MKKRESNRPRDDNENRHKVAPRDEAKTFNHPQSTIGEIKVIIGGPFAGGSFKSLKKS